ncbi:hypothetical protein I302_100380 [Kwoniella bestiolae CBS 10118]|uniref:Rab family protein n=1 Tax=Kwoniella bestiolae CBS 10118 TaxID=1296100 RepID=A0A1B9G4W1_9TREE|nr:hypothetical protein I302_03754 [Kwoniella bestiolae CBS 10118]OCF26077.1 hypothetical protein I302_03754 [Kwoniella bestiolae CBS 10118]
MSVVASPLHHQPFSDTELYVPSGSVSAHAELPPPLPAPIPGPEPHSVPFPIFQHRHTSPYPTPQSFSALGPPPAADMSSHLLASVSAPPAPKDSPASLPAVTPEIAPQAPLPPTPDPSPPASKVLSPTMMIKLAPPADDNQYEISFLDANQNQSHLQLSTQYHSEPDTTPRRIPIISVNSSSTINSAVSDNVETPPPRTRSKSGLDHIPQTAPAKVSSEDKAPRPKSMGPPPRPRRSHTAYPAPQSVRMQESRSAESRAQLRNHIPPLPRQASHGPNMAHGLTRALSDASANTPPRMAPISLSANNNEMPPPDLGGPDGLEAKVVLLGSQGVGKTSLILRYTTRNFSSTPAPATIGSSLHTRKLVHDGTRVKLQIWDTAGQERFRSMAPIYYRGAHVCVLVYDISDRQSFEDVRSWLEELSRTVPKETVIFVVGAKIDLSKNRVVTFEEARSTIKTWLKPPPTPEPTILLSPPPRSLFRSSTNIHRMASPAPSNHSSNTGGPPARSHSYGALSSLNQGQSTPPVPAPRPIETRQSSPSQPFPVGNPSVEHTRNKPTPTPVRVNTSSSPPSVKFLSPISPTKLAFPTLQSPTKPTSATFTDPVGPQITPASAMMAHRSNRSSRFSISGVLGLSRTTSFSGAASSLAQLAEMPTSPRASNDSVRTPSIGSTSASPSSSRVRHESTPLSNPYENGFNRDRRKSEDWSSRSWKMGQGPGAAETLGEFGDGVKRKQSGELLVTPLSASTGSGFKKQQQQNHIAGNRSRGSSLGRDPRLYGDELSGPSRGEEEADGVWGVDVEGIRLGECSALSGQGVEALFKSITSLLVEKKDKIERERVLRKKNSVMLVDPSGDKGVGVEGKDKGGYGCCA